MDQLDLELWNRICECQSCRAHHSMELLSSVGWDPFEQWVADLGRREGEFLARLN